MFDLRRIALLAVALVLSLPAAGDELWRGPAAPEGCRIVLVNEVGSVRAGTDPAAEEAVLLGAASELTVAAAEISGRTELTVARRDESDPGTADVELRLPPGCALSVRTGAGAVEVEIGRESPPVAVETVTGDVTVRVDPAAGVAIELATSGEITTDFTIAIDFRYHQEPSRIGRVAIGTGVTEVRLSSRRGAVRVLRPAGQ